MINPIPEKSQKIQYQSTSLFKIKEKVIENILRKPNLIQLSGKTIQTY